MPDLQEWLELYASGNPTVKFRAARALLRRPEDTPLTTLLDILDSLSNEGLGAAVERVLGKRRDPELRGEMIARLASPDISVRRLACGVLGRLGNPEAAPRLARMIDDPELLVRRAAIQALVALNDPIAVKVLEQRLSGRTDDDKLTINAIESALMMLRIWRDADRR